MSGGYDNGYRNCQCFWGIVPGSFVNLLCDRLPSVFGLKVLDAGCGEFRNLFDRIIQFGEECLGGSRASSFIPFSGSAGFYDSLFVQDYRRRSHYPPRIIRRA